MGWRISEEAEVSGIDLAVHGETAYENVHRLYDHRGALTVTTVQQPTLKEVRA